MRKLAVTTCALAASLLAHEASATPFQFTITGAYSASFQIDSDPTPDYANNLYFTLYDIVGTYQNGISGLADIRFYVPAATGGLTIQDFNGGDIQLFNGDGPQMFSGRPADPTFVLGTYALNGGTSTVTIAQAATAVPEPATWAMMVVSFGVTGATMRYRRRKSSVAFA